MNSIDWAAELGWGNKQIEDIRLVGYSYIKQGIYNTALTFFNALTVLSPGSLYDLQTIGALHLELGNGLKALEHLDKALKIDPSHTATQLNRAKALFMLGYKQQAIAAATLVEKSADPDLAAQASLLIFSYRN